MKPHSQEVTSIQLNPSEDMIITGGKDNSIFIYKIVPYREYIQIEPVGLLPVAGPVQNISWKPNVVSKLLEYVSLNYIFYVLYGLTHF